MCTDLIVIDTGFSNKYSLNIIGCYSLQLHYRIEGFLIIVTQVGVNMV